MTARRSAADGAGASLISRAAVTLCALAMLWIGSRVVLPGVEVAALRGIPARVFDELGRLSIFMLGMTPLYSAAILIEIAMMIHPPMREWRRAAPARARAVARGGLALAFCFAALQADGVARAFLNIPGAVAEASLLFRVETVATLVGATAALGWLATLVSQRGLGSGFWVLLAAPTLTRLPGQIADIAAYARQGALPASAPGVAAACYALCAAVIVAAARGRDLAADEAAANEGRADRFGLVWPLVLADLIATPVLFGVVALTGGARGSAIASISYGSTPHLLTHAALVVVFATLRSWSLPKARDADGPRARRAEWAGTIALVLASGALELATRALGLPFALDATGVAILSLAAYDLVMSAIRTPSAA